MGEGTFVNLDRLADEFEAAWVAGESPRIERFLDRVSDRLRSPLLVELLRVEVELRRRAGETPTPAEYAARWPEDEATVEQVFAEAATVEGGLDPDATWTAAMVRSAEGATGLFDRIGDYEIEERVGRGGMGFVYRARQLSLGGRLVALKTIRSGELGEDEEAVRRFRAEAEAAARLVHPHIVPVYEFGQADGQWFFSMELVRGGTLADLVREGPLEPRRAAGLLKTVAEAVAFAHERGVVHRDMKPGNVLLTEAGEPKVTDFGIAKRVEQDSGMTATGQIMGTPSYMAPEQARGEKVGPSADVYALGAILYCLLTGRPPFQAANSFETMQQVVDREPVAPRQLNSSVPRDLETICLKALQKAESGRYESANAIGEELGRFLGGRPIRARPIGWMVRTWKAIRRNPVVSGALFTTFAALLAGLFVSVHYQSVAEQAATRAGRASAAATAAARRAGEQKLIADENARTAERQRKLAEDRLNYSEGLRYAAKLALAQQAFERGHGGLTLDYLDQCPWDRRGWEFRHLWTRISSERTFRAGSVRTIGFGSGARTFVSWEPDAVMVRDAATGRTLHEAVASCVAIAPDREHLVMGVPHPTKTVKRGGVFSPVPALSVRDLATFEESLLLVGHEEYPNVVAFDSSGTRIASASTKDRSVRVWDATTGEPLVTITIPGFGGLQFHDLAFGPGGGTIVVAMDEAGLGTVRTWDVATSEQRRELQHGHDVDAIAFSPDGRLFVATGGSSTRVFDTDEWTVVREFDRAFDCLAFNADNRLATGDVNGTVRVFDVDTGRELATLPHYGGSPVEGVRSVAFDGKGRLLLSAAGQRSPGGGGSVKIWDASRDRELSEIAEDGVGVAAISPDGAVVARATTARPDDVEVAGCLTFWDAETGRRLRELSLEARRSYGDDGDIRSIAFAPNGREIATASSQGVFVWDLEFCTLVSKTIEWDPALLQKFGDQENGRTPLWGRVDGWCLAFSGDGRVLVGSNGADVHVWDLVDERGLARMRPSNRKPTDCVAVSPEGDRIATVTRFEPVAIWSTATGEKQVTLEAETAVTSVAFSPDGRWLATGGKTSRIVGAAAPITVWDASSGEQLEVLRGHTADVESVVFDPTGRRLVSSDRGSIRVWDVPGGIPLLALEQRDFGRLAFDGTGRFLIGSSRSSVRVLDGGRIPRRVVFDEEGWPETMALDAEGRTVALGCRYGLAVWDARSGTRRLRLADRGEAIGVALTPSGDRIAAVDDAGLVGVLDGSTGDVLYETQIEADSTALAFGPDGRRLVAGGKLHDVATGELQCALVGHTGAVRDAVFFPGGRRIATAGDDGTVRLWESRTGRLLRTLESYDGPVQAVAVSPNGDQVACCGRGSGDPVRIWDVARGTESASIPSPLVGRARVGNVDVVFADEGRSIVGAGGDGAVRTWSVASGALVEVLEESSIPGAILQLGLRDSDNRVFALGDLGRVCVWDLSRLPSRDDRLARRHDERDLVVDGDFESAQSVRGWGVLPWNGNGFAVRTEDHLGDERGCCLRIENESPNDVLCFQVVEVERNTQYVLTGRIRTENVEVEEKGRIGASLAIWGGYEHTEPELVGTTQWTDVRLTFDSADRDRIRLGPRLGHHGSTARGTAWFDDVRLEKAGLEFPPAPGTP